MARIPEFQRQRLASSAVGVAAVDQSGGILSRGFSSISERATRQLASQKRAEITLAKERRGVLDTTEANLGLVDFNNDLGASRLNSNSPEEALESANTLFNKQAEGFESEGAKAKFLQKASVVMNRHTNAIRKDFQERELESIVVNLNQTAEGHAEAVSRIARDPSLSVLNVTEAISEKIEQERVAIQEVQGALGPENTAGHQKEVADAMGLAAVYAFAEFKPEQLDVLLSSDLFDGMYSDEEISEFKKTALDFMKLQKAESEFAVLEAQDNRHQEIIGEFSKTGLFPTVQRIRQDEAVELLTTSQANAYIKAKSSGKAVFAQDNPFSEVEIQTQFIGVLAAIGNTGKINAKKVEFTQVALFQQRVLEGLGAGTISKETGLRWLKASTPIFNEGIETVIDRIEKFDIARGWYNPAAYVSNPTSRQAEASERKAELESLYAQRLLAMIDVEELKTGETIPLNRIGEMHIDLATQFAKEAGFRSPDAQIGDIHKGKDGLVGETIGFDPLSQVAIIKWPDAKK